MNFQEMLKACLIPRVLQAVHNHLLTKTFSYDERKRIFISNYKFQ